MTPIRELAERLEQSIGVFWQGGVSDQAIAQLEHLLGVRLPHSFREFLREYGGGGEIGQEISGIEGGDPANDNRGTVNGDTLRCRQDYGLPAQYTVVYFTEDDIVWCLDTSSFVDDECPVVAYDVFNKSTLQLFSTFGDFFEDYLTKRVT